MPTAQVIAISCIAALLLINIILPGIQEELEGESVQYEENILSTAATSKLNATRPESATATYGFLGSVWGLLIAIFKIVVWNFDFNIYINFIMTVLKVALILSIVEIVKP